MKVAVVFGTRPELIKVAPIIWEINRSLPSWAVRTICTGQHREMIGPLLSQLNVPVSVNFDVMRPDQSLNGLLGRLVSRFDDEFSAEPCSVVIGQGDTTTVLAAALSSFQARIPFAHVEAGLRSKDMQSPFPEEMNRVIVSRLARYHFCPTETAKGNLLTEGVPDESIFVTGNTVIDTLLSVASKAPGYNEIAIRQKKKKILVTLHRRENHGIKLVAICSAIRQIVAEHDVDVVFPVHPNPNVGGVVRAQLGDIASIKLSEPLDYYEMAAALSECHFVLTDSGGLQEEAPALGKPVLIAREETERPELVVAGGAVLVGSDPSLIFTHASRLLLDTAYYDAMVIGQSPFGRGDSAAQIVQILQAQGLK